MTFLDEVRKIFKTYDPGRLYLSERIAKKYTNKSVQQDVLKGLVEIYRNGGVGSIDFSEHKVKSIEPVEEVVEEVSYEIDEVSEIDEIEEIPEVSSDDNEDEDEETRSDN